MTLSKSEFENFKQLVFKEVGISLSDDKIELVKSRLYTRLMYYKIDCYSQYLKILQQNHQEIVYMVNLITTNETYFFREELHFDFLKHLVKDLKLNQKIRVWSAAASVGAEAYSIAMVLDDLLTPNQWEILGSDINTDVLEKAKKGLYCESWVDKIPQYYKEKYCLKGKGKHKGQFLIDRSLLYNIKFERNNLTKINRALGVFDVIFLRNVLIYFDTEMKKKVIKNILLNLKPNGYLIISLTESLEGLNISQLKKVQSSIYQKVG